MAHDLLAGRRHQRGVVDQALALVGVLDQLLHAARERIASRLVPGHQQQHHQLDQLVVRQCAGLAARNRSGHRVLEGLQEALVLRAHQDADEVVLGLTPPFLDDLGDVLGVLDVGGTGLPEDLGIVHVAIARDHRIRPGVEALPVLLPDADHLCDQEQGQRDGDVGDEVALPLVGDRIDGFLRDLSEGHLELLDHPGCESPIDQLAQLSVARLCLVDQAELCVQSRANAQRGCEDLLVLRDVGDVRERRNHPQLILLAPIDGVVLAQPAHAFGHLVVPAVGGHEFDVEVHGCHLLGGSSSASGENRSSVSRCMNSACRRSASGDSRSVPSRSR